MFKMSCRKAIVVLLGGGLAFACAAQAPDSSEDAPESEMLTSELSSCGTPPPDPDGQCVRIVRAVDYGKPYLDAYTSGNGDVVTRDFQNNSTQLWCFTKIGDLPDPTTPTGSGITVPYYTIQHRTFSGQYLDALGSSNNHKAVLRNAENNASQEWVRLTNCPIRLQQRSTQRYLDGYASSSQNYRAVTRGYQFDGTQDWLFE